MFRYRLYAVLPFLIAISFISIVITNYAFASSDKLDRNNTTYGHSVTDVCAALIKIAEQKRLIPLQLLLAVAYVESTKASTSKPWPWTVNLAGDSHYFSSRQEAIDFVNQQLIKGKTNIDIGCMQINYKFHKQAFETVTEMFDPLHNVAYATTFLLSLYERFGSWADAIRHYHSSIPDKHLKYQDNVMKAWDKISTVTKKNRDDKRNEATSIRPIPKPELTVEEQAIQDLILDTQKKFQLQLLVSP